MYRLMSLLIALGFGFLACTEQHDPRHDWEVFAKEQHYANRPQPILNEDGSLPGQEGAQAEAGNIDAQYNTLCSSCHGATGAGDGPAGAALEPRPRNFVTWDYSDIPDEWKGKEDEYIAKVIREGGASVGKSSLMAPWGSVLSDQEIELMVKKVKSFHKP